MADRRPDERRRVCLECGTPKFPQMERCLSCRKVTLTHLGQARESLCQQCRFVVNYDSGRFDCGWARKNNPHVGHRIIDDLNDRRVDFYYRCGDFSSRRPIVPSPNPLSFQERESIRAFIEIGAFWFDPYLWDGVDPKKDDVWEKQAARQAGGFGGVAVAVAVAAAAGLLKMLLLPSQPATAPASECNSANPAR